MDLKHKPSRTRIAADKYKSKFVTKPTHLPKPVCHRISNPKSNTGTDLSTATSILTETDAPEKTMLTPATSSETHDAIEALLMLGDVPITDKPQLPEDDNAMLVPIIGTSSGPDNIVPANPIVPNKEPSEEPDAEKIEQSTIPENLKSNEAAKNNTVNKETPLPSTVLGLAIKIDIDEHDTSDKKAKMVPTRKELSIKQYRIKRKYKSTHRFKCNLCPTELPSVQEYNKHYIDTHPPLPCLDCTRVFTSPRTLAKHWYTHAEYMFECQDCGHGFIFKSQLESHQKVHLKMAGYVCFKPKCGKWFKRESELNAHLITHDNKEIKCEHCNYSNPDICNAQVHSCQHSDKLPFHCPLCQKGFWWQEQKRRHLKTCDRD